METHIEGTATKRYGATGATVATGREGKYLSFSLSGEDYGFPILKVKEIIGMMPITSVPRAPEYVKGVVNLRGKVIPVVDLRLKFGFEVSGYTDRTLPPCLSTASLTTTSPRPFPWRFSVK